MKKNFYIFCLVLILASIVPLKQVQAADDISGHFFEDEMRTLIDEGILKGYGDGTYKPQKSVKRSEFTAFLVRSLDLELEAAGELSVAAISDAPSYKDVKPGQWFYPAVNAGSSHDLITGFPDNTFRPSEEINREQMAVMMMRALDLKGVVSEKANINFSDSSEIGNYAKESVQRLVNLEVLTGKKDSNDNIFFDPKAPTTRAQASGVIVRMMNVINPKEEKVTYRTATIDEDGGFNVADEYDTFSAAKKNASGNQVVLKGNNILWVNDGLAVSNKFTTIYTSETLSSSATYVTSGIELDYKEATEDWVKVQVADTVGYVAPGTVNLVPTNAIEDRSHYVVSNGNLVHKLYNPITESKSSYVYGKAPSFLDSGDKYYSWNGNTFYDASGNKVGTAYQYFNRMPLYTETDYTAAQLDAFIEEKRPNSPLLGLGESFKKAEEMYGTNAMYLLSHAILESNWGTSDIATKKNNLFGINAVDSDPFKNAYTYDSYEDGILDAAKEFIVPGYFDESDWRYNGAHLGNKSTGMNVRYASDPYWGEKISSYMYQMDNFLSNRFKVEQELGKYPLAVTLQGTNVRSAAKVDADTKLYRLETGATVAALDEVKADGTWYRIVPKNILDNDHDQTFIYSHGGSYGTLLETLDVVE
ncbi:S-layer homology domain-containing protein [Halobacillus salinus]|uniref:S-layer homology domain-containing protein n=1 Tax=Halobacillus salinus TaxID=192814 RepID=UPI0009A55E7C|nr:S-layer homology domain-containing protein [Halobacillus salinus]